MNEYFNWSKVYSVSHVQGSYLIFTVECANKSHAGVMLPAFVDDIWNMAGSRLVEKINTNQVASSHDALLTELNDWMALNLKGQFSIEPAKDMYPPLETEVEA